MVIVPDYTAAHRFTHKYRLAKDINVPARRINEIVQGKRSISADTALRLARYFVEKTG